VSDVVHVFRRVTRAAAVVGLVAWAIGSGVSLARVDADLFHRFGALGVAAAVLFFTDRLLKIELQRQRTVEKLLHEYGLELEVMKSGTDPREIPAQGYVIDFLTEERQFDRLRASADRINVANVALLTLSTLQWGFGDLFLTGMAGAAP
jgi:hypothetical protein